MRYHYRQRETYVQLCDRSSHDPLDHGDSNVEGSRGLHDECFGAFVASYARETRLNIEDWKAGHPYFPVSGSVILTRQTRSRPIRLDLIHVINRMCGAPPRSALIGSGP